MDEPVDLPASDSADANELDLTPQPRDSVKRGSRRGPTLILFAVLLVIGFVLFQGLSGATLFLRQADAAVAERDELAERRFRLLGTPIAITEEEFEFEGQTAVAFSIACDGTAVDIIHRGNVAESFQMGVPVVLEGRWTGSLDLLLEWDSGANDGFYFESDRMLVKHDNEYREDRIEEAASCGDDSVDAPEG
ncbi:MAG: cytochrome c-type biogenesis protein CcmE [Verrucomicrobiales bacterium]|jgi:cytochrome c-type biogenesis protein CcmE